MKSVSARIPEEAYEELSLVAKETERDISFHVRKAIEAYLGGDLVDLIIARDRLMDESDEEVSIDALRKELDL